MVTEPHAAAGRLLALDIGRKRTGLALSDATRTLATPWSVIADPRPLGAILQAIDTLRADDDGLAAIVVGRPVRLDGRPNEQTAFVDDFVAALRRRTDLPIVLRDERLTSVEAESRLAAREPDWRRRKDRLDAAAAAIILQDYLDTLPA